MAMVDHYEAGLKDGAQLQADADGELKFKWFFIGAITGSVVTVLLGVAYVISIFEKLTPQ